MEDKNENSSFYNTSHVPVLYKLMEWKRQAQFNAMQEQCLQVFSWGVIWVSGLILRPES